MTSFCAALALTSTGTAQSAEPPFAAVLDRVAAVVDDVVILRSAVVARAKPFVLRVSPSVQGVERRNVILALRREVLEKMIDELLIAARAEVLRITVAEPEVDSVLAEVAKRNGVSTRDLEREVAAQGLSLADYRADLRRQLVEAKWIRAEVLPKVAKGSTDERALATEIELRRNATLSELRKATHVEVR